MNTLEERTKELEGLYDAEVIDRMIIIEQRMRDYFTNEEKKYLAVEGLIGTGKSTLVRLLATRIGLKPYLEQVDDNDLWKETITQFYKDRTKFGSSTQITLLHMRRAQAEQAKRFPRSTILDRTYWADRFVFVPTLVDEGLPKREVEYLEGEYEKFKTEFPPVDLLLMLKCKPETANERINQRQRTVEMSTDLKTEKLDKNHYLVKIGERYAALPKILEEKGLYTGPIVYIDQDTFRVTDGRHTTALLECIAEALNIKRKV
ncbi:MAG: deoxynucleoside kinase [bacterium]|nr:deoxynucleoside kinase [bacterium]